jgi:hypothetical protein
MQCVTFHQLQFIKADTQKPVFAAVNVEEIVQLTLDNIPTVRSNSENEDPEIYEKIIAKEIQLCVEKICQYCILNTAVMTRTSCNML